VTPKSNDARTISGSRVAAIATKVQRAKLPESLIPRSVGTGLGGVSDVTTDVTV
jgi:hypothetical protein